MRIIKVLTNKDAKHFNKEAPKYEVVIAGFFMVRCPACESFKPAWNNFVKSCQNKDDPRVLIAEVDSNQTSNVDFDTSTLEGFPTVYRDVKSIEGVVTYFLNDLIHLFFLVPAWRISRKSSSKIYINFLIK